MKPPYAVDIETTSISALSGSVLSVAVSDGVETHAWAIRSPGDLRAAQEVLSGVGREGSSGVYDAPGSPDGPTSHLPLHTNGTTHDKGAAREEGQAPPIIVHYVPMESSWSELFLGNERHTNFRDTALMAYRVDPGEPMKLASVVARHLPEYSGWKGSTEEQLADPETGRSMLGVSTQDLLERNAVDACLTRRLHDKLWPKLTEEERQLHEEDVKISMFVSRMSQRGMHVSEEALVNLRKDCLGVMDREQSWLRERTGDQELNPGSNPQMARVFESRGVSLPSTKAGMPSVSGLALRVLRYETQDTKIKELVDHVLAYRKAQDQLGDNVTAYAQARDPGDGRIRGGFFWPGTSTFRPSCFAPNRLNVPRKGVRQLFTAPAGMSVIEIDLKQAEPRISAQQSQDPVMLREFKNNEDPYIDMARYIYKKDSISRDERQVGKVIYLAAEYGIAETGLWETMARDDLIVPIELVRRGLNYYWKKYERLGEFIEEQEKILLGGGDVFAPSGGYHWGLDNMELIHPYDRSAALRAGFNATIQSVPPRIVYRAGLLLEDTFEIVNSIYDSLLGYLPTDEIQDRVRKIRQVFRDVVASETWLKDVDLPVEIKVGTSWGTMKEVASE